MTLLKGKTALITGGSDGIGYAIAEAFASQGAGLVLIGRDSEKLNNFSFYSHIHIKGMTLMMISFMLIL